METKDIDFSKLSPMMKQYFEVKNKYKNHILFYRLGDFYEMFFDDAIIASRELELTLTGRDCGLEERQQLFSSVWLCAVCLTTPATFI